jgi:hypothetical protein
LECVSAIVDVVSKGFVVWLPFKVSETVWAADLFVHRVFSTLEKAQKAFGDGSAKKFIYAPYRMHHCGAKNVIYVYSRNGNIIATNVLEDFESLVRSTTPDFIVRGPEFNGFYVEDYTYEIE